MTIFEAVNEAKNQTVRVQTIKSGWTEFNSSSPTKNKLLLGRVASYPVQKIEIDKDGAIHIYGLNYLDYNF